MTKDKGTVPFQRQRTVKTHQCFYSVCVQCSYRKFFIAEKYVFFFFFVGMRLMQLLFGFDFPFKN